MDIYRFETVRLQRETMAVQQTVAKEVLGSIAPENISVQVGEIAGQQLVRYLVRADIPAQELFKLPGSLWDRFKMALREWLLRLDAPGLGRPFDWLPEVKHWTTYKALYPKMVLPRHPWVYHVTRPSGDVHTWEEEKL